MSTRPSPKFLRCAFCRAHFEVSETDANFFRHTLFFHFAGKGSGDRQCWCGGFLPANASGEIVKEHLVRCGQLDLEAWDDYRKQDGRLASSEECPFCGEVVFKHFPLVDHRPLLTHVIDRHFPTRVKCWCGVEYGLWTEGLLGRHLKQAGHTLEEHFSLNMIGQL